MATNKRNTLAKHKENFLLPSSLSLSLSLIHTQTHCLSISITIKQRHTFSIFLTHSNKLFLHKHTLSLFPWTFSLVFFHQAHDHDDEDVADNGDDDDNDDVDGDDEDGGIDETKEKKDDILSNEFGAEDFCPSWKKP